MKPRQVFAEYDAISVIRIFKSRKAGMLKVATGEIHGGACDMDYAKAVSQLRHRVWEQAHGFCELCADPVIESSGHLHEMKHRGRGGEMSVFNSVFICARCHQIQHKDRNPRWSRRLTEGRNSGKVGPG